MKCEKIQLKDIVNGPIGDSSFLEIYKSDETDEIRNAPHPATVDKLICDNISKI